ncbi:hypothetical protein OZN62_08365 [Aurantiacibacter sp. MUD11]|uniref:7TM domain-containing protein n=1 Tax=Aurantiacibacter sp. MUD11 TaxID=3003265 RepID=UPI0022AA4E93|nr:7TM domain-containing protein [Aurantiacibacter sp. MUD11]WAT16953.1 hypothetical protein OZN62_08365 [Aurantiacibacter sp. MUD11]
MFSKRVAFIRVAIERATPQVRRPALLGMAVLGILAVLVIFGLSNTRNPFSMPSQLGGIAVSQAVWGLKPSNLLMVLPIGAFLVVLARSFIGMKAFGLFTPMLIALAFLQIGPIFGPIVMICAIGSGMVVAPSLLKLRMTRVGFLGVLISLVVFILAALQGILDTELQVDAFPVVVTALCVERWWRQWEKDGYFEAAHIAFNTLALALVIQFVMVSQVALMLIEVSPLLLPGFAAIAITILGRYRGLRMTEIGRFMPIWYEGWRRKMGWDEVIPDDAIDEVLAARAAIDQDEEDRVPEDVKLTVFPKHPPAAGRQLVVTALAQQQSQAQAAKQNFGPAQAEEPAAPAAEPEPIAAQETPASESPALEDTPVFARSIEPLVKPDALSDLFAAKPEEPAKSPAEPLSSFDWDRIRAELNETFKGPAHAEPAFAAQAPYEPAAERGSGSHSAFFGRRASLSPLVDPALLGFLRPNRRHSRDQREERDHREVQSAAGDRAGTRQGGGQGGAGGRRGGNNRHNRRHLRLWSA